MKNFISITLVAFLILASSFAFAQDNAIDFDGVDDFVSVPDASSLIASSNAITMSCWVYPTDPIGGFPNFDGFLGFRNNSNADFYMLQLNATNVECRFRNSGGTNYDVVQTGMVINTWQHYVMSYDGSTLRVYLNGVLGGSTAATGSITSALQDFQIGKLDFGVNGFVLDGQIDEVGLWDRSLTAAEVACMYEAGINPEDPNLQLFFDMNQGVAEGNNAGLTTVIDRMGNIDGILNGAALNGATSNWVSGLETHTPVVQTICSNETYFFAAQNLDSSGIYYDFVPVIGGCDSIVRLSLTVLDTGAGGDTLHECSPYTWIDGNDYSADNNTAQFVIAGGAENGCDSTITLNLTIVDATMGVDTFTACESFTWTNGVTYTNSNITAMDTIPGGASSGCDSIITLNLDIIFPATSTETVGTCGEPFTWIDDNTYTTTDSTATFTIPGGAANTCDSIVTLNLTITIVDTNVTQNGFELSSTATGATYQWLDCNNGYSRVVSEINASFTPDVSGLYAVEVTQNSCVDTSACYDVNLLGITQNSFSTAVLVYPNPSQNELYIDLGGRYETISMGLYNIQGQLLSTQFFEDVQLVSADMTNESSGVYFVHLTDKENRSVYVKVIKE